MPHTNAYSSTAPQLLRVASPYRGTCSNGEWGKKKYIYIYIYIYILFPLPPVFEANANGTPLRMTAGYMGSRACWRRPRPVVPPSPTRPPFLSVFLSACLPWSSSCFSSAAGPARRGQIQSDRAMLRFPWLVEWYQPWLPSRPGLAA